MIVNVHDVLIDFQYRHKRSMKHVECEIATHILRNEEVKEFLNYLKFKFFNCVSLKFESTLFVEVHTTFLLLNNRQNIAIEKISQDANSN